MKWGLKSSQHVFCALYFSFTGYINRIYEMPVRNRNFSVHLTHVLNAIYTRTCSSAFSCLKYTNYSLKKQCVCVTGTNKGEVTGERRKLVIENILNQYYVPDFISIIKCRCVWYWER